MVIKEICKRSKSHNIIVHCSTYEETKTFITELYKVLYPPASFVHNSIQRDYLSIIMKSWVNYRNKLCYNIKDGRIRSVLSKDFIDKYGLPYKYEFMEWNRIESL